MVSSSYASNLEVRWCPGCGDYSILRRVQSLMGSLEPDPSSVVFVSGIGCSSRFPYYMDTYGLHGIHGRAPAIATGVKLANKALSVWVVTGDGDALSIGGNHLIHLLRRNLDINVLLFNNEIYGLTKGQYSPTSPLGKKNKTALSGVIEVPVNPLALALGASGTFIARVIDTDAKLMDEVLTLAHAHSGTSLIEIYQNCNVFNDKAFDLFSNKKLRADFSIRLEHGRPLLFGDGNRKGLRLEGLAPCVVDLEKNDVSISDLWIHDMYDKTKAYLLTQIFDRPAEVFPRPFGVFYTEDRSTYEEAFDQNDKDSKPDEDRLQGFLKGSGSWSV